MLHEGRGFAQRAIVVHRVFGDAAAAVVGDVQPFARRVDRQMAGTVAARRDGIQQLQLARLGVHGERADAARLLAFVVRDFVDRVEELVVRVDGQERRAGGFAHQADRRKFPGGRLKSPRVNSLALIGSRVSADIGDVLAFGSLGGLRDTRWAAGRRVPPRKETVSKSVSWLFGSRFGKSVKVVGDAPGEFLAGFDAHVDISFGTDGGADGPEDQLRQRAV